jgi:hypothetical protein
MPRTFQRDFDGLTDASLVHAAGDLHQFLEGTTVPNQDDLSRATPLHLLPHGAIGIPDAAEHGGLTA